MVFVTSSDGARIYAEANGDPTKPALVLVPGYTLSTVVFNKQFQDEELQKELYLIRYDMRGHGQSSMPETLEGHSSKLYADDFRAVCEAFNVTKPVFAGWSLGGCIAADICTHLGSDYLSGIIYLAALYALDSSLPRVLSVHIKEMSHGLRLRDDVTLYKRTVLQFADGCFYDPSSIPYDTRIAWLGAAFSQPPAVTSLVFQREQDPKQLFEAGKKGLKCLYLHGKEDTHRTSPMAVAEELRPYFGDAMEVVEVDKAGHAFFFEQPEVTNRLLLNFVKKVNA